MTLFKGLDIVYLGSYLGTYRQLCYHSNTDFAIFKPNILVLCLTRVEGIYALDAAVIYLPT